MSYNAEIEIKNTAQLKLLNAEFKGVEKERFKAVVEGSKIKISAEDATALKAILNSVSNTLVVFEKMESIK
jgi:tRNA threonylcarbamoyladenosine modification (KEOPS) complex  Pcc1 subunit